MAKVHSLAVRKARGQMGGMVYSTYGGQTIVREKPAVVSNPRTNSQMNQRVKMANVVSLYRPNRAWMEEWAFPERPQKWSNYNAYMSENLAKSVVSLTKDECAWGVAVLEPLTFTKGSLPIIPCTFNRVSGWITDIMLHNPFDPTWTVAEFTQNLLDSSRGWQEGDQLSIIIMQQYMRTVAYTPGIGGAPVPIIKPVAETIAYEVTLDSSNTTDKMEDFGFDEVFSAERTLIVAPDALCLDTDAVAHGLLFVHSRKAEGGVTVSTQALILDDFTTFNEYASVEQRRQARASYNATPDAFLIPNSPQEGGGDVDTQGIASVNNITAGQEFNIDETPMGDVLAFTMNKPFTAAGNVINMVCYADSETEGGAVVNGSIAVDEKNGSAGTLSSALWNTLSLPADYVCVKILSLSVVVDDVTYSINFAE